MPRNTRYTIPTLNLVHETIDGETIVLKLDTGVYYSLNDFGGEVWSLLGRGFGLDEIVTKCVSRFDGPRQHIEGAVRGLVADLERDDLIAVEDAAGSRVYTPADDSTDGNAESSLRALQLPVMRKYEDMQDLLLIDPFHDVPAEGWPERKDLDTPYGMISSSVAAS